MSDNRICIGIISWFPYNEHRDERVRRCRNLIDRCNELFDIPIIIIAQNWRDEISGQNMMRHEYEKLGITRARKTLWTVFKQNDFDWMICFDDDSELDGDKSDANRLLYFLKNTHSGYMYSRKNEFKLCAFHKTIIQIMDIPDLDVTVGTGVEDYAFFQILENIFPDKKVTFDWGTLADNRQWANDKTSSWNRRAMPMLMRITNDYIKKQIDNG